MKAAFGVERIGLGASEEKTARMLSMSREFNRMGRPWVAEITGLDDRRGYARTFLRHKADYTQANSSGTRGVWFWWTLESGRIYQAQYRETWSLNSVRRRLLAVADDGDITDLTEEEVRQWLSGCSASTS